MEVGEGQALDQFDGVLKILLRLSRKADDHVRADRSSRHNPAYAFYTLGIMSGAIPAMHGAKDAVGGGLQRHVKMGRQAIRRSHKRYEFFGDVLWLDGTEPKLFERSFFQNAMNDIGKAGARREIPAVRAKINPAENDLSRACADKLLHLCDYNGGWQAAAASADKRNHTVRAAVVAAILNF